MINLESPLPLGSADDSVIDLNYLRPSTPSFDVRPSEEVDAAHVYFFGLEQAEDDRNLLARGHTLDDQMLGFGVDFPSTPFNIGNTVHSGVSNGISSDNLDNAWLLDRFDTPVKVTSDRGKRMFEQAQFEKFINDRACREYWANNLTVWRELFDELLCRLASPPKTDNVHIPTPPLSTSCEPSVSVQASIIPAKPSNNSVHSEQDKLTTPQTDRVDFATHATIEPFIFTSQPADTTVPETPISRPHVDPSIILIGKKPSVQETSPSTNEQPMDSDGLIMKLRASASGTASEANENHSPPSAVSPIDIDPAVMTMSRSASSSTPLEQSTRPTTATRSRNSSAPFRADLDLPFVDWISKKLQASAPCTTWNEPKINAIADRNTEEQDLFPYHRPVVRLPPNTRVPDSYKASHDYYVPVNPVELPPSSLITPCRSTSPSVEQQDTDNKATDIQKVQAALEDARAESVAKDQEIAQLKAKLAAEHIKTVKATTQHATALDSKTQEMNRLQAQLDAERSEAIEAAQEDADLLEEKSMEITQLYSELGMKRIQASNLVDANKKNRRMVCRLLETKKKLEAQLEEFDIAGPYIGNVGVTNQYHDEYIKAIEESHEEEIKEKEDDIEGLKARLHDAYEDHDTLKEKSNDTAKEFDRFKQFAQGLTAKKDAEIAAKNDQLSKLKFENNSKDLRLNQHSRTNAEWSSKLQRLQACVWEKDNHIQALDATVRTLSQGIDELDRQLRQQLAQTDGREKYLKQILKAAEKNDPGLATKIAVALFVLDRKESHCDFTEKTVLQLQQLCTQQQIQLDELIALCAELAMAQSAMCEAHNPRGFPRSQVALEYVQMLKTGEFSNSKLRQKLMVQIDSQYKTAFTIQQAIVRGEDEFKSWVTDPLLQKQKKEIADLKAKLASQERDNQCKATQLEHVVAYSQKTFADIQQLNESISVLQQATGKLETRIQTKDAHIDALSHDLETAYEKVADLEQEKAEFEDHKKFAAMSDQAMHEYVWDSNRKLQKENVEIHNNDVRLHNEVIALNEETAVLKTAVEQKDAQLNAMNAGLDSQAKYINTSLLHLSRGSQDDLIRAMAAHISETSAIQADITSQISQTSTTINSLTNQLTSTINARRAAENSLLTEQERNSTLLSQFHKTESDHDILLQSHHQLEAHLQSLQPYFPSTPNDIMAREIALMNQLSALQQEHEVLKMKHGWWEDMGPRLEMHYWTYKRHAEVQLEREEELVQMLASKGVMVRPGMLPCTREEDLKILRDGAGLGEQWVTGLAGEGNGRVAGAELGY
ncbi:MAG: hypothetical protein M1820_000144 [Bogoriella megaspora]|nr:MAG: hypothetical protein M1820_000144 [Bogoriella megaspora]